MVGRLLADALGALRPWPGSVARPLLLTLLLGGLWHGASWNFVLWGGLHGTYLTIERILRGEGKVAPASWTTLRAWLKATWILDLRVGERDLGLLPIAVARGHPHGLAEAAAPRQRRTRVVVCPRGASGARDGPGGGFVARRWEWRFPIVETLNPLLPAVLVLGAFLVFFFAALDSSPFNYFYFQF